jgi:hypothetical protein
VVNERLRIGDAERDEAARELGEHFALGRITADEHSERLDQVWSARTAADLAPAFRDLPRARQARPEARRAHPVSDRSGGRRRRLELPHVPFPLKVLIGIVAIWWGFHHFLLLVLVVAVYVLVVRRFVRRFVRPGPPWHQRAAAWGHGRYQTGWH